MGKNLDWITGTALGVGVLLFLGCRDEPPPERFNVNLGTPDRPLLPVSVRQLDPSVLEGRADIVPLPTIEDAIEPVSADEAFGTDADRAAIAQVIEQFESALAVLDPEALVPLVVESQREMLENALRHVNRLDDAIEVLRAAVVQVDPDLAESLKVLSSTMRTSPFDKPGRIKFASDDEAFLPVAQSKEARFEKSEVGWRAELPALEEVTSLLGGMADAFESLATRLQGGTIAPADLPGHLATIMQTVAGTSGESEQEGEGD
jgi:hypothetical protein